MDVYKFHKIITAEDFIARKAAGGSYRLTDTTAGADLKHVKMYVNSSGHYKLSFFEDDLTTEYNILEVHRNATSVDFIQMKANVGIGLNYLNNDGTNNGLSFDSSNMGLFSNKLTVNGQDLKITSSLTDSVNKGGKLLTLPYLSDSQVEVSMLQSFTSSTINLLSIGGSSGSNQALTQIELFTAATVNTTTGTRRLKITATLFDFDLPFEMSTNSIGYNITGGLSFDSSNMGTFSNGLKILNAATTSPFVFAANDFATNDKFSAIASFAYVKSQVETATILAFNTIAANLVNIGGGSSQLQAATAIRLYTTSSVNTVTGTIRLEITDTEIDINLPLEMNTNSIGYTNAGGLSFDASNNAQFSNDLNILTGRSYKHNGSAGLTETLNFNGSVSGEVLTLTVAGGIIIGKTVVP